MRAQDVKDFGRPKLSGCLHIFGMLLLALGLHIALIGLGPSSAAAACKGPCSEEQMRTGLASPPAWAESRSVHFEPESLEDSAYTPEELEGEGGPILYLESGHVQHNPKVNLIFWGSNFNSTEKGIEVKTMLQNLFKNLSGSEYQGILTQYFDSTGRISGTVATTSYFDEKVKAPEKLTILKLEEEISSAVSVNKWPIETSAQYFLVTAPGSTYETLPGCAFHGVTRTSANVTGGIVYSFVPYQGDPPYSTNGCVETGNPSKNPVYKTSKSASHEYAEAATDPLIDGSWTAASGKEISDICQTLPDFELSSGAYAQAQYDDHLNGCASADPEPPHAYAITEAVSGVKAGEATLRGTVNAESLPSSYYFEYGTTKAYGSKTAETSAGSGITNQLVSKTVTGLAAATTYHYRVVETNSTGTTTGEDKTFSTTGPPPTAATEAATRVTATEAILHGSVNPNGFATTVQFEYGLTTAYGSKAPTTAESAGAGTGEVAKGTVLTGLLPGTTYHFRLKATSAQGTSVGSDLTLATASLTPIFSSNFGSSGAGAGQFNQPTGIAVSPVNGNLVVPDEANNRVEIFNEKGEFLSQFGSSGSGNGQFNQPRGAAVDTKGNIWVVDTGKNRIQKFNEKGEYLLQFSAGTNPIGVAVDDAGNVWTANDNETGAIEEHNEKGEFVQSFATRGTGTGQVREPKRLAVDANGYVWVPDALNNRIEVFNSKGEYVNKIGSFGSGSEQMNYPVGVAVDPRGNVWVDDNNNRIDRWKVPSPWPPVFSSNFGSSGAGNGQFSQPTGIAFNPMNGNLVVPDEGHNRIEVFNEKGEYRSQFGSFGTGNGQFNQPRGAAVDLKGNIWIVDTGNNRVQKFNEGGEYLLQLGTKGTGPGQFTTPKNLAVDSKGNVYVADSGNKRIEKFNEKGEFLLQLSTGTNPIGLAVDAGGNIWTATDNTTGAIEEHNAKGELLRSFASKGEGNGQVWEPKRLAVDANGYVWVPEAGNDRVEVFTADGEYVTQLGSFGSGSEQMSYPVGVAVDPRGNVWVDDNNNRIDRWVR
jgi:DNA-binding beta-propeller fold protein YncE